MVHRLRVDRARRRHERCSANEAVRLTTCALRLCPLVAAGLLGEASTASALDNEYLRQRVESAVQELEWQATVLYTGGFSTDASGPAGTGFPGTGIGLAIGAEYRLAPRWSVGVEWQGQQSLPGLDNDEQGLAGNAGFTYHRIPFERGDPWIRVAAGYRFAWDRPGHDPSTVLRHGFEPAVVTLGYDVRIGDRVALAPLIGADLTVFAWRLSDADGAHASLKIATYLFGGLQGRFATY